MKGKQAYFPTKKGLFWQLCWWPYIREHQQKNFVTLVGFWLLRGWRGLGEAIKKAGFFTKIFFSIMVSEVLKTCKKSYLLMYIRVKVKQQETTGLVVWLYHVTLYKKYLQNLIYIVKQACILHLILSGMPLSLILSCKNMRRITYCTKSTKHDKG